ncbi:MAG: hypothetical protein J6T10_03315 [Methanobrevibacter sp.]|nr:hypothetical protein [Methanobrevibacter sp.]
MNDVVGWLLLIVIILEFVLTGLIHYLIGKEMSQAYLDRKNDDRGER